MSPRATLATLAVGALAITGMVGQGSDGRAVAPAAGTARTAAGATPTPALSRPVQRPNILMITVDDMAASDLPFLPTVVRSIQGEGVSFSDAIAPTPICVPARASLLTGQYAHNHGARTIQGPHGGYPAFDETRTVATALQASGYQTLFTGKYLNGYGENGTATNVPVGWTHWRGTIDPSTYHFLKPQLNVDGRIVPKSAYTTDVMTAQALEMIRSRDRSKPWFTWVNYVAPHAGTPSGAGDPMTTYPVGSRARIRVTVPDRRDRGAYAGSPLPAKPNRFPHGNDELAAGNPIRLQERGWDADGRAAITTAYQRRLEALRSVDRAVGRLLRSLRLTRQLSRTLVVFASDNGYSLGEHNLNGKLYPFDEPMRIPVLMRGPGVPKGRTVSTTVTNPDLAATLLAATGVQPPRPLDGDDVMPWLTAPEQWRLIPIEAWPVKNGTSRHYWGVRIGPWTYVEYKKGGQELYDRSTDPFEQRNLARDDAYRPVLERLHGLALRYRGCAGASCPHTFYPASSDGSSLPAGLS